MWQRAVSSLPVLRPPPHAQVGWGTGVGREVMTSDLHSGSSGLQFSGEGQAICFVRPKPHISRYTASYKGLAQTNSVVVLPIHQVRITVYKLQGQGSSTPTLFHAGETLSLGEKGLKSPVIFTISQTNESFCRLERALEPELQCNIYWWQGSNPLF